MLGKIIVNATLGILALWGLHLFSSALIGFGIFDVLRPFPLILLFNLFLFFGLPAIIFKVMYNIDNHVSRFASKWLAIVYFTTTFLLTIHGEHGGLFDFLFVAWMWPIFFVLKYGFFLP